MEAAYLRDTGRPSLSGFNTARVTSVKQFMSGFDGNTLKQVGWNRVNYVPCNSYCCKGFF